MDRWMDGCMHACMHEWIKRWMDGWMNGSMDGRIDGWKLCNGRIKSFSVGGWKVAETIQNDVAYNGEIFKC